MLKKQPLLSIKLTMELKGMICAQILGKAIQSLMNTVQPPSNTISIIPINNNMKDSNADNNDFHDDDDLLACKSMTMTLRGRPQIGLPNNNKKINTGKRLSTLFGNIK
eukprot:106302_1